MRESHDDERQSLQGIRQHYVRQPQRIGDIVGQLMARRGYANVQTATEWTEAWNSAAGKLANRSRPGRFNGGVLEIIVDNSAALQELMFRKKQLITSLSRLMSNAKLKDLRFKVGQIE